MRPLGISAQITASQIDYITSGQCNLETLNVVSRRPIFERARAGGIRRNRAAKKATALSWIGWIKEILGINKALEIGKPHARFSDGAASAIVMRDAFYLIEFVSREDDAGEWNAPANCAGARAGDRHRSSR